MSLIDNIGQAAKMKLSGQDNTIIRQTLINEGVADEASDEILQLLEKDELLKITASTLLPIINNIYYTFGIHTITIENEYLNGISTEKRDIGITQIESVTTTSDLSGNSVIIKQQGDEKEIKIEHLTIADSNAVEMLYKYILEAQKVPKSI